MTSCPQYSPTVKPGEALQQEKEMEKEKEKEVRRLPDVVIVGVKKSGTMTLGECLLCVLKKNFRQ